MTQRLFALLLAVTLAGLPACVPQVRVVTVAPRPALPPAPTPVAGSGTLPVGAPVVFAPVETLSSLQIETDTAFRTTDEPFVLMEDVRAPDGRVLLPAGSPVLAVVTRRSPSRVGRPGAVTIAATGILTPNGVTIPLDSQTYRLEGRDRETGTIAGTVLLSWTFVGLLMLLRRGGDVDVAAQTRFEARTAMALE